MLTLIQLWAAVGAVLMMVALNEVGPHKWTEKTALVFTIVCGPLAWAAVVVIAITRILAD